MKTILKITAVIFLITGCGGAKIKKLIRSGSVSFENHTTTIPFEYRMGIMIIKVDINGNTYDFMLDTGASNVVSKELNEELNLSLIDSEKVYDVHGKSQQLSYAKVDNITIGKIDFRNTIGLVHDFNAITKLSCLNIDGIIGANLMRKAIWDFNFKNQTITITDSEENLTTLQDYEEVKFFEGYQGSPSIIAEINGTRVLNTVVDTGSNGAINLTEPDFHKFIKKQNLRKYVKGVGTSGIGVFGPGESRTFYKGLIDNISFGDLDIHKTTIIGFRGSGSRTIGMEFLKNYRIVFNWKSKKIKFTEVSPYQYSKENTYGFGVLSEEGKLFVKSIIENSSAYANGLKIGDQIVGIDNVDYSLSNPIRPCERQQIDLSQFRNEPIALTILRDAKVIKLELDKTIVLQ